VFDWLAQRTCSSIEERHISDRKQLVVDVVVVVVFSPKETQGFFLFQNTTVIFPPFLNRTHLPPPHRTLAEAEAVSVCVCTGCVCVCVYVWDLNGGRLLFLYF